MEENQLNTGNQSPAQTETLAAPTQEPPAVCAKCGKTPCVCSAMPKPELDERVLSAICYVPFLALLTSPVAVIKKPKSKFCEFHASQGLVLFIVWFISLWVVAIFPSLLVGSLIWFLLLLASLMGIFKAWGGAQFEIPGLAAIAKHLPVKNLFVAVKKEAAIVQNVEQTPMTSEAPKPEVTQDQVVSAPEVPVIPASRPEIHTEAPKEAIDATQAQPQDPSSTVPTMPQSPEASEKAEDEVPPSI